MLCYYVGGTFQKEGTLQPSKSAPHEQRRAPISLFLSRVAYSSFGVCLSQHCIHGAWGGVQRSACANTHYGVLIAFRYDYHVNSLRLITTASLHSPPTPPSPPSPPSSRQHYDSERKREDSGLGCKHKADSIGLERHRYDHNTKRARGVILSDWEDYYSIA